MSWIDEQLVARGIHEARVLDAMRRVPRDAFARRSRALRGRRSRARRRRRQTISIEQVGSCSRRARETLAAPGCDNIEVIVGDGRGGYAAAASDDGIAIAAPHRLHPHLAPDQRAEGGRLVIPVGPDHQRLTVITLLGDRFEKALRRALRTDGVRNG